MLSPCWPFLQFPVVHPVHRISHVARRAVQHFRHHIAAKPHHLTHLAALRHVATNTACRSLPHWVFELAAIVPVAVPLSMASLGPQSPVHEPAPVTEQSAGEAPAVPITSVMPDEDPGSSLVTFPSYVPSFGAPHPNGGQLVNTVAPDLTPALVDPAPTGRSFTATGPSVPSRTSTKPSDLPPVAAAAVADADSPHAVPEPSALLALAVPTMMICLGRRRRIDIRIANCAMA
jgi:hypothetical protein